MDSLIQFTLRRPDASGPAERWTHRGLSALFLALWGLVLMRQFDWTGWLGEARWPEAAFLVSAALVTVSSLARQVSLYNALAASVVLGLLGASAHWASYVTQVPFGPLHFPHAFGTSPVQEWFFVPALLWVTLLLNARGLARLFLAPRARHPNHGWHLLGLSVLLMLGVALAFEPFASTAHHYWLWGQTRLPVTWQGVPLSCLLAWMVVSVIASIAATPFLINKHPRPSPPRTDPAWIWLLLSALFALGNGRHGLGPAAVVAIANGLIAATGLLLAAKRGAAP